MGFKPDIVYTYKDGEYILRTDYSLRIFLNIFVLVPLVIFGLLGNTLIILVLRRCNKNSVNILLFNLAIWDIIFLIGQGVQYPAYHYCKYYQFDLCQYYLHYYDPILTPLWCTIVAFGQSGSIYTTLIITIERFIVVLYPLHARSLCTTKITVRMCITVFFISVAFGLPYMFAFTISPIVPIEFIHNDTNYPKYTYAYTGFGSSDFFTAYIDYGQTFLQFVIPFIILSILNTMTALQVKMSTKVRNNMSINQSIRGMAKIMQNNQNDPSTKPDTTVSKMLVCVVLLFGICYFPYFLESIITQSLKLVTSDHLIEILVSVRFYIWNVGEITTTLNSSLNFMVYCLLGTKFRSSMFTMFSEWKALLKCRGSSTSGHGAQGTETSGQSNA